MAVHIFIVIWCLYALSENYVVQVLLQIVESHAKLAQEFSVLIRGHIHAVLVRILGHAHLFISELSELQDLWVHDVVDGGEVDGSIDSNVVLQKGLSHVE